LEKNHKFKPAYISAILLTVGFLLHYIPMFILGLYGMPRRYYDYLAQFEKGNFFAGIGAYLMVAGILMMLYNLFISLRHGEPAEADPWGGTTLEWSTSSPPPLHNFSEPPETVGYPYDFTRVLNKLNRKQI